MNIVVFEIFQWPWMASIGLNQSNDWYHYCGGSVINKRFIITAAHCFHGNVTTRERIKNFTRIRLGDQNLKDIRDDSFAKTYEPMLIVGHPQYDFAIGQHSPHLLFLFKPVGG